MPTYEYACQKCGHEFEQVQSIAHASLTTCPKDKCGMKKWGKGKIKRKISTGGGIIFKGTGFYITDYRSESYKEAAKKDVAPAAPPAKESSGTSDTAKPKPAKTEKPTPKKT